MLRLTRDHAPAPVDVPILRRPDPTPSGFGDDWDSVVLERQLVDWDAAASRTLDERVVSYVLPLNAEPRRTVEWLSALPREGVEIIVVGIGLRRAHHVLAASIAAVISGARFLSITAGVSTSAATNIGIAHTTGDRVVLLRPEAQPARATAERLAEAMDEPGVAIAQPLVLESRGLSSPPARDSRGRRSPRAALRRPPSSDARRLGSVRDPGTGRPDGGAACASRC